MSNKTIWTIVPGRKPIELVAWCPELESYYQVCEPELKSWCVELVEPDWRILDIGAHIGYYSIMLGDLASRGHVWAYEPGEANCERMRSNLDHNDVKNVTVMCRALGTVAGAREDVLYETWGVPPQPKKYEFSTVDAETEWLRLKRLDFVKIDVDGYECEVLEGARATLDKWNPWLAVEVNEAAATRGRKPQDVCKLLIEMGYQTALVLDGENYVMRRGYTFERSIELSLLAGATYHTSAGTFEPDAIVSEDAGNG